ncbi:MAG TPA: bifunctional UDP-sugar hydrolase/5'-nucleotidase [Candidatus Eisenbacteria bacterium]|nr:bifunctional UDP-sugar hydrolase/5'-nucleotidase [Candidatus Eisenbacteria bacterium]
MIGRTVRLLLIAACLALPAEARRTPPRPTVRLDVLYTSDVHGHLGREAATFLNPEFPPSLGGGASAAGYIAHTRMAVENAGGHVLLFDSGDWFTGTPLGQRTQGRAVIDYMNRQRYDASAVGNHDFDQGRAVAESLAADAKFPILAANLYDTATGQRVSWAQDVAWFDAGPIRIAVLGYITEATPEMAFQKNIAGLEFRPVIDMVPADVARVRARGADLVFVLLHQGLPWAGDLEASYRTVVAREQAGTLRHRGMDAMELARAVPGVDAWFCGHTHQGYNQPWEDPVTHALVFEPYANGSSLGHVTFTLDAATRQITRWETHFDRGALLTLLDEDVLPDTTEDRIIGAQVAESEQDLNVVVGHTEVALQNGPAESALLGFVMADAFREELNADVAIQNTGGVRGRLVPGPITRRALLEVSPFGNGMVLMRVPGGVLRGLIEDRLRGRAAGMFVSGMRVRFDLSRPEGARIVDVTVGGAPLDTTRTYTVATTDYLAEGNSGLDRLRALPPENVDPAGFTDRDVLERWLRRHDPLRIQNDGRWQRVSGAVAHPAAARE